MERDVYLLKVRLTNCVYIKVRLTKKIPFHELEGMPIKLCLTLRLKKKIEISIKIFLK